MKEITGDDASAVLKFHEQFDMNLDADEIEFLEKLSKNPTASLSEADKTKLQVFVIGQLIMGGGILGEALFDGAREEAKKVVYKTSKELDDE